MTPLSRDVPIEMPLSGIWETEWSIQKKGDDAVLAAATGLSVTVFVSATKEFSTAEAIDASLSVAQTERPGKAGTYSGAIPEAAKETHLATYAGRLVYEVMAVNGVAQDYQTLRVRDI